MLQQQQQPLCQLHPPSPRGASDPVRLGVRRQELVPDVQPLAADAVRLESSESSDGELRESTPPAASPAGSRSPSPSPAEAEAEKENGRPASPVEEGPAPPPPVIIKRTVKQVGEGIWTSY